MFDGNGWWVIFPIIGIVIMVLMTDEEFDTKRRRLEGR